MNCKICGAPMEDGAGACKNCGTTLAEMGVAPKPEQKLSLSKEENAGNEFARKTAQFGGVQVKERRSSIMAEVDTKTVSMALIIAMLVIFFIVKIFYDHKTTRISVDGFDVTLPSSMRRVNDDSFRVQDAIICRAFANNQMEFTCVKYDAATMIPGLNAVPDNNDVEGLSNYLSAQNKLVTLDDDFTSLLDETFAEDLKDYKCLRLDGNELDFTFRDTGMVDDYVEMRIRVEEETVYQFSLLCSEEYKDKLSKKFDEIFASIEMTGV